MNQYPPKVWGPHGWNFIHFIIFGYPDDPTENDKIKYKTFLMSIKDVLPCGFCSKHYKQTLEKYPLDDEVLSCKLDLIDWGIKMHNAINKSKGKKQYSFEEGYNDIKSTQETHD